MFIKSLGLFWLEGTFEATFTILLFYICLRICLYYNIVIDK